MTVLMAIALALSLLVLVMTRKNLAAYEKPPADDALPDEQIAVCIPARNEAGNIEACVRGFLDQDMPSVDVWVYDDQSDDETPEILARLAAETERVRLAPTRPLPDGWNGKQHACLRAAEAAMASDRPPAWLLFTDADVRVEPGAVRGALSSAAARKADLVSTFPRQIVGSIGEILVVPMIFFLLFSYLPFGRMRSTNDPAASAGCGQFLFVRSSIYREIGGHGACQNSMHDGIKLPRAVRAAGHHTDLFDGTHLASVRMYSGMRETWRGFAKNAYEGLGSVFLLTFLTVIHALGHVLPWILLIYAAFAPGAVSIWAVVLAGGAIGCHLVQRIWLALRFETPAVVVLLHPLAVVMMTLIQCYSYGLHLRGTRSWRGRVMTAET